MKMVSLRHKRFCKLCHVNCNGTKSFYYHVELWARRTHLQTKENLSRYLPCNKIFESHVNLLRNINKAANQIVNSNPN